MTATKVAMAKTAMPISVRVTAFIAVSPVELSAVMQANYDGTLGNARKMFTFFVGISARLEWREIAGREGGCTGGTLSPQ